MRDIRIACVVASLALSTSAYAGSSAVKASSVLKDSDGVTHAVELAFDGLLSTSWAEGEVGPGEGSWFEITLDHTTPIESVSIWPGDLSRDDRSTKENGRPKSVTVELIGKGEPVTAQTAMRDVGSAGAQRVDVTVVGDADRIRIHIDEVYNGYLHDDTYVAEVALNFAAGTAPAFDKIDAYIASDAGVKAAAAHKDEIITLFDRYTTAEFGDRDALAQLVAWAGDGAPYLRDRVKKEAPLGYRLQALPADAEAIGALLKLKDPNAIPGIQLAALRSRGKDARRYDGLVSYFEAYAQLKGGGRRVIAPWGEQGWEKGALHTFGEPPGVALGQYGDVYVADTANQRVNVYGPDGRLRSAWGKGDPNITDVWFGGKRRHYVSGMEASTADGGFTDPIAVAIVPGHDPDEVVVLDALGRVSWFDGNGQYLRGWKVDGKPAEPGVGGGGHLLVSGGSIIAIVGSKGYVFNNDGELKNSWDIEDGAPIAAAVLKNGRLALGFHRGAVEYDTLGFRHKVLMDGDELPNGYEAWSLATDEKGKLWAVTDRGDAVKFKSPGKPEFAISFSKVGLSAPRFAVFEDMLFVAIDGKVLKVDVLELRDAERKGAENEFEE